MLGRFELVGRVRPLTLVRTHERPPVAPYVAAETPVGAGATTAEVTWRSGSTELVGRLDAGRLSLRITHDGRTTTARSRRHGRARTPVRSLALTLTGRRVGLWSHEDDAWVLRGLVDLEGVPVHDPAWLAELTTDAPHRGGFGELGLRDLRLVTHADGTPYREVGEPGRVLLSATSAGPGPFRTAHTSIWSLDVGTLELAHRADLFVRRPGRGGRLEAHGDHAAHLLRDGDRWLLAASTWGDFDRARPGASVGVVLAESTDDVTRGTHLLDVRPLTLPTTGLTSVGVWDPHLVRDGDDWLVGYVSATRFFSFHPVLASGPSLDDLRLRAASRYRTATEGTTLHRHDGRWVVLASDGRDGPRGLRARHPVLDLDLREIGALRTPYPTNIPWPTVVPVDDGWLLVTFDGTPAGGPLVGYGSHGTVVLARSDGMTG